MRSEKLIQKITGQIKATVITINAFLEGGNTKRSEGLFKMVQKGDGSD